MPAKGQFTTEEARILGDRIRIDWTSVPLDEFRRGLSVELEHGACDPQTNVTDDDFLATAKIALAHLKEFPDYYTRLAKMEAEAKEHWSTQRGSTA
ncbi:MAG: hypothetical protein OER89_08155 [Gemmatimonadota bacterium]|nr:hypothetical protein [Gemmatimonadota bacterium]MDH3570144.1 hypothetical protein [Gemmatimonadota bacterium]MDH5549790.1 hypothetical protein [Gemmatimonadota bacterium]